jgi:hypothetical protein
MPAPDTTDAVVPSPTEEQPKPMHEVHPPHEAVHTRRGFLLHIATIVIGLLIAVLLEQTVEFFHDRHERNLLEEQMHEVFAGNLRADEASFKQLGALRSYLIELKAAVVARQRGESAPAQPPVDDPRMASFPRFPNLAPYEAAREKGTIALLPTDRIRLYNRVAFQRELTAAARDHWFNGLADISAFQERYVDSIGSLALGEVVIAPRLEMLSADELSEYLTIIAALIKKVDLLNARLHLFDLECRAILNGVRNEDELVSFITPKMVKDSGSGETPPQDGSSAQ